MLKNIGKNLLKSAACLLAAAMLSCFSLPNHAKADTAPVDTGSAKACLLIEAKTGKPLFEYNSGEELPAAGLSRLAALLVICEAFDRGEMDKTALVTVSDRASRIGGTTAFLRANEQIDAESLLLAAAMINAGDATAALASAVCGSETAAVMRINERMAELGIPASFADVCGEDRLFTARELAKLGSALITSGTYNTYGTKYYEKILHSGAGETELANPNKLLRQYSGCLGVGTGSSQQAGYCGVFAAKRGETVFVAVVLGADTGAERFRIGAALLDCGFSAFRSVRVGTAGESFGTLPVTGSLVSEIEAVSNDDTVLLLKTNGSGYVTGTEFPPVLEAPVEKGDTVGKLIIRDTDGEVLAETELVAADSAPKAGFIDCFAFVLRAFTGSEYRLNGGVAEQT
ncbi:MAG: D-alanyl-D-alanine carboxypeptidase [Clostridia bacterium]|nr:D-alanyl-D-alanine carboxypeptidase [Clostridia bacterium]